MLRGEFKVVDILTLVLKSPIDVKVIFVYWTNGDQIAIFDNGAGNKQYTKNTSETNPFIANIDLQDNSKARFSGNVTDGTTHICAVYPYKAGLSATATSVTVDIPSTQTPTAGTFANNLNVAVASLTKTPGAPAVSGTFLNVCALVKFKVPDSVGDVSKVTLKSNDVLAGSMNVNFDKDGLVCSISTGEKSVHMEGSFTAGSTFCFVVAPTALSDVSVDVVTSNGIFSMQAAEGSIHNLTAGEYRNLGELKVKAKVDASHTKDAEGNLTGSRLEITLPDLANNIEEMTLKILNDSGSAIWEGITSLEVIGTTSFKGYPYLPEGSYILTGEYKTNKDATIKLGNIPFSVKSPNDIVSLTPSTAYTSYTKYVMSTKESDATKKAALVTEANNCLGTTLYIDQTTSKLNKISHNLIEIYGEPTYKTNITGAGDLASTIDNHKYQANELGAKIVTTYGYFAGSTFSTQETHYITGLPYTLANDGTWESVKTGTLTSGPFQWSSNTLILGNGLSIDSWLGESVDKLDKTSRVAKNFHVPANIQTTVTAVGKVYGTGRIIKQETTGRIVVSGTTVYEGTKKGQGESDLTLKNAYPTLTSSNSTIYCENTDMSKVDNRRTEISSLSIQYK